MQLSHNGPWGVFHGYGRFRKRSVHDIPQPMTQHNDMRFDDRLMTVADGDLTHPRARAAMWRQLVDLLAQDGTQLPAAVTERCLRLVQLLQSDVPEDVRREHMAAVAPLCDFAPLIAWMVRSDPPAAFSVVAQARLNEEQWLTLVPLVAPYGRQAMRARSDLSPLVGAALAYFSTGDRGLPSPDGVADADVDVTVSAASHALRDGATAPDGQRAMEIGDLVRRIEDYRSRQSAGNVEGAAAPLRVSFHTDAQGILVEILGAPRARFIGIDLGQPAVGYSSGSDAAVARIVAKRGAIVAGRLVTPGEDNWGGLWLCDATARFDDRTGQFIGYVGALRRPLAGEVPVKANEEAHTDPWPELMRQMLHELRSPLNAIHGFAQLIEGQYLGPAPLQYRDAAGVIQSEATGLLHRLLELDLLATGPEQAPDGARHVESIVGATREAIAGFERRRFGTHPAIQLDDGSVGAVTSTLPSATLKRIISLVLAELTASDRQPVALQLAQASERADTVVLRFVATTPDSPAAEAGQSLGLAIDEATRLARSHGAQLALDGDQYILNLPLVRTDNDFRVAGG